MYRPSTVLMEMCYDDCDIAIMQMCYDDYYIHSDKKVEIYKDRLGNWAFFLFLYE